MVTNSSLPVIPRRRWIYLGIAASVLLAALNFSLGWFYHVAYDSSPHTELVLQEYARVNVVIPSGNVSIIAGSKLQRRYEWGGCRLDANMYPRQERWFGNLGIYDASAQIFNNPWAGCDGISRPVVEEGQMHFADSRSAEIWISRRKRINSWNAVWTNDGVFIQWGLSPQRDQLNVELVQICIKGKKPIKLAGADDTSIVFSHPQGFDFARRECINVPESVIAETQKSLIEDWRKTDEWIAKSKH